MIAINSKTIPSSIKNLLSCATSEENVDGSYEQYKHSQHLKLYGFEQGVTFVGCIGIKFFNSNKGEIKHIAVSPSERGNGIGGKMIKFVCQEHLLSMISAETDQDAVGFYRRLGFNITSLGEKYPNVERFLCVYNGVKV